MADDPFAQYHDLSAKINLPAYAGAGVDSQYLADAAMLRNQITKEYADLLQQLGYTNSAGQFVMGDVESQAAHDKAGLEYARQLAIEKNTQDMQNAGTLFSGWRGTTQARAEHPFVQGIADLDVATPKQLAKLYEHAGGLMNDYVLQNNQLLAAAAQRAAAGLLGASYGSGGGGGGEPTAPATSSVPQSGSALGTSGPVVNPSGPGAAGGLIISPWMRTNPRVVGLTAGRGYW